MHGIAIRSRPLSRRHALRLGLAGGAALAAGARVSAPARARQATPVPGEEAVKVVGDVVDFRLGPDGRWEGAFGSVTLKLHPGYFDGQDAWFIRTDASDAEFAAAEGLVHVPLLRNALDVPGGFADIYLFAGGTDDQRPVLSTAPGRDDFTPAFRVHRVTLTGEPERLDSVAAITAAEQAGTAAIEPTDIVVNYPLVTWPDGGLPVDDELTEYLGTGPLIEEPDTEAGTVTFKLHQCYPGSRYFVTDTSAAPMAPMMGVVGSPPTQKLSEAKATAPIYVFGNGLKGPGAMGFQPAIFNSTAGDPAWSPFWDHVTVVWKEPARATLLTSEADVKARAEAGEVDLFNGTPDTHPNGFVVNCPSPVLAPPDYDPAQFAAAGGTPAP
jgi:hypothetical protein